MGARIPIRRSRAALWSRRAGVLAVPVIVIGGVAHRVGAIPTFYLLAILCVGLALALIALVLALYAWTDIWRSGAEGGNDAAFGVFYASPALVLLGAVLTGLVLYPSVSDVTTDIDNPPVFEAAGLADAAAPNRESEPNTVEGVAGRLYELPVERVYQAVRFIVEERGWEVVRDEAPDRPGPEMSEGIALPVPKPAPVSQNPSEGFVERPEQPAVIEAIPRSLLFAIPDQVAIRLEPGPEGVNVDLRSRSLIGRHDLGQNARRINAFLDELDAILQGTAGLNGSRPGPNFEETQPQTP